MKKLWIFLFIFAFLLCGCQRVEQLLETTIPTEAGGVATQPLPEDRILDEPFRENRELEYVKWRYDNWHHGEKTWVNLTNLTGTCEDRIGSFGFGKGWKLLASIEEYDVILTHMGEVEQTCTAAIGIYRDPYVLLDTWQREFDAQFFEDYSLAVVDFCNNGSYLLESRLDSVTIRDGRATVSIRYETLYASTAEGVGDVYWIPVPKNCTELEVEMMEVEWNGREEPYVYDTLSEEELAEFQALFDDPMGWYARALTSEYISVSDVDLEKMFYCGAGDAPVSEEELEYLKSQWDPILFEFDIVRCDEAAMDEAYQLVFGREMNKKHRVGLENMTYYNGAYFRSTSDVLITIVRLDRGIWRLDGAVDLYYKSDVVGGEECCISMELEDGRWIIRSNRQID